VSTSHHQIQVSGFPVEIVRKDIKNLHVGVYPPAGRVRVAAPLRFSDDAVRLAIVSRLGWIRRQQAGFQAQERQSQREMVTGESHFVQGRRYRLRVIELPGAGSVQLRNNKILELAVDPATTRARREVLLNQWYRLRMRCQVEELIPQWEPVVGVALASWGIKRMKTRWGTCNAAARRIWLNSELAKKSISCLEFILVHEMVHLLERQHNNRFRGAMDRVMPNWRRYREELNRAPLAHENWKY